MKFYYSNEAKISYAHNLLINKQLLFFEFCLETSLRPSKRACNSLYELKLKLKFSSSTSKLYFFDDIMSINLKTTTIHVLTCISMHQRYLGTIIELRIAITYLRIFKQWQKSDFQAQGRLPSSSFSFFPSLFFSFLLLLFSFLLPRLELSLSFSLVG